MKRFSTDTPYRPVIHVSLGSPTTLNPVADRLIFAVMSKCFARGTAACHRRCALGLVILAILIVPVLMAGGCQSKGDPLRRVVRPVEGVPNEPWVLTPVSMRVYPSTRFVKENNQALLEARVETLDEMGDSIKAVGRFRLELFDPARKREVNIGQQLYSWDVPMWTLDQQRQCYDPVTRAYRFRLILDTPTPPADPLILRVTFTDQRNRRLEAQASIKP